MTFSQSLKTCLLKKYFFVFKGRASRSEFWWFMLFILVVDAASFLIFGRLPARPGISLSLIVSLLLLPPNLGVTVRRFHDRNLRGWWIIIPIASVFLWMAGGQQSSQMMDILNMLMGLGYLLILILPGQPETNRFGPPPETGLPVEKD